jgi:uncharacterized protein YbcV (DUF1398 family)
MFGIDRNFLSVLMKQYSGDEDIIIFHAPSFRVEGAGGWFTIVDGKVVIQMYQNINSTFTRDKDFKYFYGETLAHEIMHYSYWKYGIPDKTHYFHFDQGSLMLAVYDIKKELMKRQVSLLHQAVGLYRQLIAKKPATEVIQQVIALHHSATPRDLTKPEVIIEQQRKKYNGKTFYNQIIDAKGVVYNPEAIEKERGTWDILVLGDFTKEKPSGGQIQALKALLDGREWTTHKALAERGLGTPSLCPGNLEDYL